MTAHVQDIPAMFAAGVPVKVIAAEVGIHRVNVYRRLKAEGVRVKPDRKLHILTLMRDGVFRAATISKRSGISRGNTYGHLVELRDSGLVRLFGFTWCLTEAGRARISPHKSVATGNGAPVINESRASA